MAKGYRVNLVHLRTEHKHLDGTGEIEVEYDVFASITGYVPATYDDPAEGGDVEIESVVCRDPRVNNGADIDLDVGDAPFTEKEWFDINDRLASEEAPEPEGEE
jgi:hypothetical protein